MKLKNDFLNKSYKELKLKKINSSEIKCIFYDDYWDGPLSGVCEWEYKKYYFICVDQLDDDGEDKWPRKYLLIKISEEQFNEELREYDFFCSVKNDFKKLEDFYLIMKNKPEIEIQKEDIIGCFDSVNFKFQ